MSIRSKFPGKGKAGGGDGGVAPASKRYATYQSTGRVEGTGKVATTAQPHKLGSTFSNWGNNGSVSHFTNVPKKDKHPRTKSIIIKSPGQDNKKFTLPSGKMGRVNNSSWTTKRVGTNDDIMTPSLVKQIKLPSNKSKAGGSGRMRG